MLENPVWTDAFGPPGSEPVRFWHTTWTWDPLLSFACGVNAPAQVLATNLLRVSWKQSTQLDPADGYGGLLYGGPGFDAAPGQSWRIQFAATRAGAGSQGDDLFVRFGITVPDGDGWRSYYANLPAGTGLVSTGDSIAYDETFSIPSNWPTGRYQFALCHTGNNEMPETEPETVYHTGFSVDISDISLKYVSTGAASPGPAGVATPFVDWPIPVKGPDDPFIPGIFYLIWEEDLTLQPPLFNEEVTLGALPHTGGTFRLTPGWENFRLFTQTPDSIVLFAGVEYDTNGWFVDAIINQPFPTCGPQRDFLAINYWQVPDREHLEDGLFGDEWVFYPGFETTWVHPSVLTFYDGYIPICSPEIQFFWNVPCGGEGPPPTPREARIWWHPTRTRGN